MKQPVLAKNSRLTAVMPTLMGGLDCSRRPWLIDDNALSECRDMWWKDGVLRTRPGLVTDDQHRDFVGETAKVQFYRDRNGYLVRISEEEFDNEHEMTNIEVTVLAPDGTGETVLHSMEFKKGSTVLCVPAGGDLDEYTLLLFYSCGSLYGLNPEQQRMDDLIDRIYCPLISVNGRPVETTAQSTPNGTLYESYNRLGNRYAAHFTSDGTGLYYFLPTQNLYGEVAVELVRAHGNESLSVGLSGCDKATTDGYQVAVNRKGGYFWFEKDGTAVPFPDSGIRNNIRVTVTYDCPSYSPFSMRFGTWYGGDRSSTAGGTRLFLSGSDTAKGIVIWSAPNQPLYFPQSGYASVGTPGEAVTAFGKQGGLLILFKEKELYTAEYVKGDTVTAEDLESGAVTDITAVTATFPLTPLHAEIGCDLPQTVALLGNRLVWACRNGTVYTLDSLNSLSVHTVSECGDAIHSLLREHTPSRTAATVCDDRYWLLWDDELFLLNRSDGTWHRFVWPQNGTVPLHLLSYGDAVTVAAWREIVGGRGVFYFSFAGDTDTIITHTGEGYHNTVYTYTQRPVEGMLCTKSYDFGTPETFKRVVEITVETAGDVQAAYVTERGVYGDRVHRAAADGLIRLTPNLSRLRRLALRLRGENLVVGSVTLQLHGSMR